MKILLTSGGTKIKIDDVRYIGNMSTGRFGSHICQNIKSESFQTIELTQLVAKGSLCCNLCDCIIEYEDFFDYQTKLDEELAKNPDIVVLCAAVSDYITDPVHGKISSNENELVIRLKKAPKLISTVKEKCPNCKLVGFKLLSINDSSDAFVKRQLIQAAKDSIMANRCDLIVANNLPDIKKGKHKVTVIRPNAIPPNFYYESNYDTDVAKNVAKEILSLVIPGIKL